MLIDKEFKIGDVVLVTANAAELKIVAADLALLGQTATITESLHCCFRLSGPSLPTLGTWVQAKHIELVNDSQRPATATEEEGRAALEMLRKSELRLEKEPTKDEVT